MLLKDQCILGIESSGFFVSVGISDKGVSKGVIYLNDGSPGSEVLLNQIDQLITMLKISKEDLDGICVTLGPGSFTSLRVSLSTAEALGLGLNIPLYGVDSLIIMAATVPFYPFPVKVIQNAYKGEFYIGSYDTRYGKPVALAELALIRPEVFYENLEENDLILGNGIDRLLSDNFDLSKKKVKWNQDFHRQNSAIAVIEQFLNEEAKAPTGIPLEPIYIRLSEAEINYNKRYGTSEC